MFSGIVEKKTKILQKENGVFTMENLFDESLTVWQSIAHDGACMTITYCNAEKYSFFAMQETLSVTNFWEKKVGDFFNVERCVKVWDRLDGHIVSWHIDTVWNISQLERKSDDSLIIFVSFDTSFSKYIIPKWSITINGVSLTIVKEGENFLSVSLIPLTQKITNLWDLKVWDKVNLEFDLVGKYILKANI